MQLTIHKKCYWQFIKNTINDTMGRILSHRIPYDWNQTRSKKNYWILTIIKNQNLVGSEDSVSQEFVVRDQALISPIFYEQLYRTQVFCANFMRLQFGFVIFWRTYFGAKAAKKMSVKLTQSHGVTVYGQFDDVISNCKQ